jgi:hypothetical protein
MATMADIKPKGKTLDLRSTNPTPTKSAVAVTAAAGNAKPAGQFHGRQVNGSAVLDLRAQATPPAPAPQTIITPTQPKAAPPSTVAAPTPVAPSPAPAVTQPAAPAATPTIAPKQSVAVPLPVMSKPEDTSPPPVPTTSPSSALSPLFNKYPGHPAVAQPSATIMPTAVAAQVDAMKGQVASAPLPPQPQSPALRQALSAAKQSTATPHVLKIGAALMTIGIMSGIVWLQNSPKLAFRNAATQAGIDASLPTYIPSSYHQTGSVGVSPGELTLNFSSPSSGQPLSITQRRSAWDSNALRENYVAAQTSDFVGVQGQGLTIYLYGNQANWINHGVWYQLTGTSKLGRADVLKIAYGL